VLSPEICILTVTVILYSLDKPFVGALSIKKSIGDTKITTNL